jgi:AhpD family alkylhydroperoxidase
MADGMDPKAKELVAIAASVAGRCQPCFRHHLNKAKELGISEVDIREAADLAERIGNAGGQRMGEFVESLLNEGKKEGEK